MTKKSIVIPASIWYALEASEGSLSSIFVLKPTFYDQTNEKNKDDGIPKVSGEKNVSTKLVRVLTLGFSGFVLV